MELIEYPDICEQVYKEELPNGLTIFVIPKRGYHKSFALFAADYGGADRRFQLDGDWTETPEGVAHFLEHKMFDMEDGDALTKLSINGANANAYTSVDITAYHFDCIDMLPENLEILLGFVSTPLFTPESVIKEQGIIAQEISMCDDDPDYCLYYGLMKSLFRSNPQRDPVAGSAGSISRITVETLYDCHKAFYHPSNMALCVAGDVEATQIADIAERILPSGRRGRPARDYGPAESGQPLAKRFTKEMEISLPIFLAGCKTEPAPLGLDNLRLELVGGIALDILAGHSSPLYFRLYEEGLISADFSAAFDMAAGAAYVYFGGETRDPERVYGEVKKEVLKLSANGPEPGMFERIKKAALGSQIRMLNSFDAICGSFAGCFFRGYDPFNAHGILSSIKADDVAAFLRDRMDPGNMAISVILPIG